MPECRRRARLRQQMVPGRVRAAWPSTRGVAVANRHPSAVSGWNAAPLRPAGPALCPIQHRCGVSAAALAARWPLLRQALLPAAIQAQPIHAPGKLHQALHTTMQAEMHASRSVKNNPPTVRGRVQPLNFSYQFTILEDKSRMRVLKINQQALNACIWLAFGFVLKTGCDSGSSAW
ncbi:hypothetical protein U9M48_030815 [Paspalum notatum var. saurae]|uniref:Uncharacterized protein n=1 Tax=Paspalum notatum var. saurae TaxID=547442 RepID=A0AAQ3U3P4_PASNO